MKTVAQRVSGTARRLLLAGLLIGVLSALYGTANASTGRQETAVPALLISEFSYNPPGLDAEREWIEIANLSAASIVLEDLRLGDEESRGSGEGMLRFPPGHSIGASEVLVIAQTAVGFRALHGVSPDFEMTESDSAVPNMLPDSEWASGSVALANDGDEILLLDAQGLVIDALNYGDSTAYFAPAIPTAVSGQSLARNPAACDTDSAVDWLAGTPTPGTLPPDGACRQPQPDERAAAADLPPIGEIQGAGQVSPLLGQVAQFRGVVTGLVADQNADGIIFYSIFVQDSEGDEDGDPATSDGIPVFLGRQPSGFHVGDRVIVTGQVTEYFGLTEIDDHELQIELEASNQPLPPAVLLDFPADESQTADYLESLEGMLVTPGAMLTVAGPTHAGCGFALALDDDQPRPIRHSATESSGATVLVLNHSDVDCSDLPALKSGDRLAGLSGPLTYHFEQFKIVRPAQSNLVIEAAPRAPAPQLDPASEADLRVATLNLYDYLLDPDAYSEASEEQALQTKRRKLAQSIGEVLACPELLGVQEVGSAALLWALSEETAEICGFTYEVSHLESADVRGIDVALLSDPRRVDVIDLQLHQRCTRLTTGVVDPTIDCRFGEDPLYSRPPLEATLEIDGEIYSFFVNHFKSKRGGEAETAPRRLAQAQHIHDLVQERLNADPQANVVVVGDFNDYHRSDVWAAMLEGGMLQDAMADVPEEDRYSYIFDGYAQLLDGILLSPALAQRIESVVIPHVNADYPLSMSSDLTPEGLAYRASDHDPILLTLASNVAATAATATVAIDAAIAAEPTASLVQPSATAVPPTSAEDQPELPSAVVIAALGLAMFLIVMLLILFMRT